MSRPPFIEKKQSYKKLPDSLSTVCSKPIWGAQKKTQPQKQVPQYALQASMRNYSICCMSYILLLACATTSCCPAVTGARRGVFLLLACHVATSTPCPLAAAGLHCMVSTQHYFELRCLFSCHEQCLAGRFSGLGYQVQASADRIGCCTRYCPQSSRLWAVFSCCALLTAAEVSAATGGPCLAGRHGAAVA